MVNPVHPLFSLEPQATPRMTLSLIALNRETGELGIALATRFLAAGAHVPLSQRASAPLQPRHSLTHITASMDFGFCARAVHLTRY